MVESSFTSQETSKTAQNTRSETAPGTRIAPGPYIGIVKNVIDPLYSGAINVYIPELGGSKDDPASWKKMMYATPFYGRTNIQDGQKYEGSPHSYGMWFVPPDVGGSVLCIFADGKSDKGFWFACIPEWPSMHMLPAISAPVDGSGIDPVVEHYDSGDDPRSLANPRTLPKFVHDAQKQIWANQGLLQDPDRGPGTSSAFRETPSSVFGISTPGRPLNKEDPRLQADPLNSGSEIYGVKGRRGGHTLVMDDGDSDGKNQMFRIRSAAGHMILMNDTKEFIYIINSQGTGFIEMDAKGSINVYAQSQMNIFAKDSFSLESQGAIKIKGSTVDIFAENGLSLQGSEVNILGSGSTKIAGKQSLHLHSKKNTYLTGEACIQIKSDGHIDADSSCHTINTTGATKATEAAEVKNKPQNMPQHEPRNKAADSKTASPTANTKNSAASNANNPYSQANGFGSGSAQQNYGPQTNNVDPVVYNSGPQGSLQGQGSVAGSYKPQNDNSSGIDWTVAGAIAGAVAGIAFGGGSSYNVSGSSDPKLSAGEAQNNPGNLPYNSSDKFAVGYNNNLAVYAKPEAGIAALALVFDNLNTSTKTRSIDIIQGFLNAKSNSDPKVIDMTRYMHNNLGIVADDYVALHDPNTRIGWVAYAIQFIQGRLIYTYDQTVTGCAMSLGIGVTDFLQGIQPITKPWQNNNGYNPLSGFVNPAQSKSVVQNGSSPLQLIGNALKGGLVGGLLGSFIQGNQSSNQSNIVTVSDANAARRYLESNPNTPSGTVFKYPDGSTFTLGGGSVTFADGTSGVSQTGGPVNNAVGASVEFTGIINNGTQGSGGCATLAQTYAPNLGQTSTWSGAEKLGAGTAQPGDVFATFDQSGKYTGVSGTCHTVIFNNYTYDSNGNINGAYVTEQYDQQPPHTAYYSAQRTDKYEVFQNFQRVTSPTALSGANVTQTQQYTNVDALAAQKSYAESGYPLPVPRPEKLTPVVADSGRDMLSTNPNSPTSTNNIGRIAAEQNLASAPETPTVKQSYQDQIGAIDSQITNKTDAYNASLQYLGPNDPLTQSYKSDLENLQSQRTTLVAENNVSSDGFTIPTPPKIDFAPEGYYSEAYGNKTQQQVADQAAASDAAKSSTVNDRDVAQSNITGDGFTIPDSNKATVVASPDISQTNLGSDGFEIPPQPTGGDNNSVQASSIVTSRDRQDTTLVTAPSNVVSSRDRQDVTPISGSDKPPGTGGANGGQVTPQGSSNTGAGGKSC
jgi:hypothetical protein